MKMKPLLVALPLTLGLAACKSTPAPASPTQLTSTKQIYVHAPSGMSFPEAVGAFQREKIVQYDHTGDDISVGYNLISVAATVAATVYVYPAPPLTSVGSPADVIASAREHLCQSEFERRKKELTDAHLGARKVRENPNSLSPVGIPVPGKMAEYEFDGVFQGQS